MRLSDKQYARIRNTLPYWIYRYADGSEILVNRAYDSIWRRAGIGVKAEAVGPETRAPQDFVDKRRFYGAPLKLSPFHDRAARARLEATLAEFIAGKDVWDEALFDADYEPARSRRDAEDIAAIQAEKLAVYAGIDDELDGPDPEFMGIG